MAEGRPVLLGLDDPISAAPHFPLFPTVGSPGHKLLLAIQQFDPTFTEPDYLRYFERITLSPTYPAPKDELSLQRLWKRLESEYRSRVVVVLGKPMWSVVKGFDKAPMCTLWPTAMGVRAAWIPHPSARNRFYNTKDNRQHVGWFLRGIVRKA